MIDKEHVNDLKPEVSQLATFCIYCGNEKRDSIRNICREIDCYWFSHWKVDKNNPEAIEKESFIRSEIADMNW